MNIHALHAAAVALAAVFQVPQPSPPARAGGAVGSAWETVSAAAGVAPDTVTVGDHFRAVVRVQAPPGATVRFPDFRVLEPLEAFDSLRVVRDSAGAWTATYPLVAWTPRDSLLVALTFRVRLADGASQDFRLRLPLPHVRSVLPEDSSLHVPRPAKAVIPIVLRGPAPRGWLLPAALLLAVLVGIAWLALRRRIPFGAATADPRAAALAKLDAIEDAGLPERGEGLLYHVRVSRVLREYLSARGGWGEDLTTTEVLAALRASGVDDASSRELERLLRRADRVKFSGGAYPADRLLSAEFGAAVRGWILAWPRDVPASRRPQAA